MRLRVARLAAGLAAVAVAVSACAGGTSGGRPPAAASSPACPAPGAGPGQAAGPAAGAARVLRLCRRRPAAGLRADLDRAVGRSLHSEIVPLGTSASGRTAYVSAWSAAFSGVAALDLASGRLRRILRFAQPRTDQADGAADGAWLVFAQTYSLTSLDRFTMYAWNAADGRLRRIGGSIAGPHGVPWPSPWHAPAVSGHYAAWAQGYGPGGVVEIRLADLATGRVITIRKGHVQPPFFDGGLVVWPESDRPDTQTTLHAYRISTGRAAALPPVLRAVHGTEFVTTDGIRTAYLNPGLTRLYYSASPRQPARPALTLPAGVSFSAVSLGAGSLSWTTTRATYLASTATGSYVQVTPRNGYATGSGPVVLVSDPPAARAAHPALALHVVRPGAVHWSGCR